MSTTCAWSSKPSPSSNSSDAFAFLSVSPASEALGGAVFMKYAPMLGAFLFAVVGCGCVNREATRVAENPPPAASPTSAAAAPSAREFDEGYHDLLDHLVVTVQPEQLLGAAWKAVVAEAANEHVKSQIRAPSLSADAN